MRFMCNNESMQGEISSRKLTLTGELAITLSGDGASMELHVNSLDHNGNAKSEEYISFEVELCINWDSEVESVHDKKYFEIEHFVGSSNTLQSDSPEPSSSGTYGCLVGRLRASSSRKSRLL